MEYKKYYKKSIKNVELALAVVVSIAVIYFGINSMYSFFNANWSLTSTFYDFISVILLIFLGLELIRLMLFHSLNTVLELIILVISRKMLTPSIDSTGILLNVISIILIVGLIYFLHNKKIETLEDLSQ